MEKTWFVGTVTILIATAAGVAWAAQSKDIISYQGRLLQDDGSPVTGQVSMTFAIIPRP